MEKRDLLNTAAVINGLNADRQLARSARDTRYTYQISLHSLLLFR